MNPKDFTNDFDQVSEFKFKEKMTAEEINEQAEKYATKESG
ncbi:MAG: hypothetical protein AAF620_15300 [Bacteroidota bacterium]